LHNATVFNIRPEHDRAKQFRKLRRIGQ